MHHPTGGTAPPEKKRELVHMLIEHGIPLIDDDAYAELQFAATPSPPAKAFARKGWVMHCGSFSKCLAPGYRLGWLAAGRFTRDVARQKTKSSLATSLPIQQGIAQMLHHGSYEAHLARLREVLQKQQAAALMSVQRHFPAGSRLAQPAAGISPGSNVLRWWTRWRCIDWQRNRGFPSRRDRCFPHAGNSAIFHG